MGIRRWRATTPKGDWWLEMLRISAVGAKAASSKSFHDRSAWDQSAIDTDDLVKNHPWRAAIVGAVVLGIIGASGVQEVAPSGFGIAAILAILLGLVGVVATGTAIRLWYALGAPIYQREVARREIRVSSEPTWNWSNQTELCTTWVEGEDREMRRIFLVRRDRYLPLDGVCEVTDPSGKRWMAGFRAASLTLDANFGTDDQGNQLRGRALSVRYPESFNGAPSLPLAIGAYGVRWAQLVYSEGGTVKTPETVAITFWRVEDEWS